MWNIYLNRIGFSCFVHWRFERVDIGVGRWDWLNLGIVAFYTQDNKSTLLVKVKLLRPS